MIEVEIYADRAKQTFIKLAKRLNDLTPIWKQFLIYWKTNLMPAVWDSKGKEMEGSRWISLTQRYLKWKQKNYSGKPLLTLTRKLFEAVKGGSGWQEKVQKDNLTIGIDGEEYFYYVQHRKTNPRYYFYTPQGDLPARVWAYMIKITDEELEKADQGK